MRTRKLFLIIADAFLLVVLILNAVISSKSGIKNFEIKGDVNILEISTSQEEILLTKEGDSWLVGDDKVLAKSYTVENLINAISSIKVLDKVSKTSSTNALENYELTETSAIKVTAKKDDKVLRTILIGKNSNIYSQSFITIDDKNDIYLATGALRSKFNISLEELIQNDVEDDDSSNEATLDMEALDGTLETSLDEEVLEETSLQEESDD